MAATPTRTHAEPTGMWVARAEDADQFRVPSGYARCRGAHCPRPPVADMNRGPHPNTGRTLWYAYCAVHLAGYNREVRDDRRVWWRGARVGATYACRHCGRVIRLAPGRGDPEAEDGPYWYHVGHHSIWCDGWGDPARDRSGGGPVTGQAPRPGERRPPAAAPPDKGCLADLAALLRLERELEAEAQREDLDEVARASVDYHLELARANIRYLTQPDT